MALPKKNNTPGLPGMTPATFPKSATPAKPTEKAKAVGDDWGNSRGQFVGLYGEGGSGKTTLACMLEGDILYIDLEDSLKVIKGKLNTLGILGKITPKFFKIDPYRPSAAWDDFLHFLSTTDFSGFKWVVIDSFTRALHYAAINCMDSVPGDSPTIHKSLEQWTYGKGKQIVYDKFSPIYEAILAILDQGVGVLAIAHNSPTKTTNADGADFYQNQPRLIQGEKGQAPGREDFRDKTDHLLYLAADISVEKGKAKGGMTRSLYTGGMASMMAKSRTEQGVIFPVPQDGIFDWSQILHD